MDIQSLQPTDFLLYKDAKVSHEIAITLAENEYDKFHAKQMQNYVSDFDRLLKSVPKA